MKNNSQTVVGSTISSPAQSGQAPLSPNPFTTYRDPETGRWMVKSAVAA